MTDVQEEGDPGHGQEEDHQISKVVALFLRSLRAH